MGRFSACNPERLQIVANNKVEKGVDWLDKLLNRATFRYYDVNANYTNADVGVDMDSAIRSYPK
jgi:hypothetical protein